MYGVLLYSTSTTIPIEAKLRDNHSYKYSLIDVGFNRIA